MFAVDCLACLDDTTAAALAAQHVGAVGRYLRDLTTAELVTAIQHGLRVWAIAERGTPTSDAYFVTGAGTRDAQWAMDRAAAMGLPKTTPIFHAVDYDPSPASLTAVIVPYVQELVAAYAGTGRKPGLYGNAAVCWAAWTTGGMSQGQLTYWQTLGNGNCGQGFPFAAILQCPSDCGDAWQVGGVNADVDWILDRAALGWPNGDQAEIQNLTSQLAVANARIAAAQQALQ